MKLALIIPAAGSGQRLGAGIPKAFLRVDGKTLLERSIEPFLPISELETIALAVPKEHLVEAKEILQKLAPTLRHVIVEGGEQRQDSVRNAVQLASDADFFAIHDAARPFVSTEAIRQCLDEATRSGAAILAAKATDTIKQSEISKCETLQTLNRETIWQAQTPQIFEKTLYLKALNASAGKTGFTDDASLVERFGHPVQLVEGNRDNIKITWPEDLLKLKNNSKPAIRIGNGYDIHRLVPNRKLVLGGVTIPSELGLDGHSDADVIIHAIMDAMLGALALGDIGQHFPNTDDTWKGADSRALLRHVNKLISEKGYSVINIDTMVIAEKPKLMPHIHQMCQNISQDIQIPVNCVSVKATTSEKIGHIGRLEGIEAHASVLLTAL